MKQEIEIAGRKIGPRYPPYLIAEISGNHNGDIQRAKMLIKMAKDSGACAVKLQTYTADSLTINTNKDEFILQEGTWQGRNLYELYKEAHTPWEWFPELFSYAKTVGITTLVLHLISKPLTCLKSLMRQRTKLHQMN